MLPNPYFAAKMRNYSQTTVVLGRNVEMQSRMTPKSATSGISPNPYFAAKIWNYSQAPVVLDQNVKIQCRHIADPQTPQPVDFCPIPIWLGKYGTIRKQL